MSKKQYDNGQYIILVPSSNSINIDQCSNLKLLLEKYIRFYNLKGDKKNPFFREISTAKSEVYSKLKNSINKNRAEIEKLLNSINRRQETISDYSFKLKTKSRLIVGLGSGSVLEVSIKLHHIYGIPYIPSSAVKGVLRAYRIWQLASWNKYKFSAVSEIMDRYGTKSYEKLKSDLIGNLDEKIIKRCADKDLSKEEIENIKTDITDFIDNLEEEKIKKIVEIFGNQDKKGSLIVLDAYPEGLPKMETDIMNVHYPEYYSGEKPPTDNQNPTPITFLTISKGQNFLFYFKNTDVYDGNLEKDIKEAFEIIGIGAKTSLGYGLLE